MGGGVKRSPIFFTKGVPFAAFFELDIHQIGTILVALKSPSIEAIKAKTTSFFSRTTPSVAILQEQGTETHLGFLNNSARLKKKQEAQPLPC